MSLGILGRFRVIDLHGQIVCVTRLSERGLRDLGLVELNFGISYLICCFLSVMLLLSWSHDFLGGTEDLGLDVLQC